MLSREDRRQNIGRSAYRRQVTRVLRHANVTCGRSTTAPISPSCRIPSRLKSFLENSGWLVYAALNVLFCAILIVGALAGGGSFTHLPYVLLMFAVWCLFSALPLFEMIAMCTNVPKYRGMLAP